MALQYHPLPLELFDEKVRPYIARHNTELRNLFALEGCLKEEREVNRSDRSIARGELTQVHTTRITPSISEVVSGISTAVGTPSLTLSTGNIIGSTTTAISINSTVAFFGTQAPLGLSMTAIVGTSALAARADHRHSYGDILLSTANNETLEFRDDGTDSFLSNSLGFMQFYPASEFQVNGASHANGGFTFNPSGVSTPVVFGVVRGHATAGTRTCLAPAWFSPDASDAFSGVTFRCWDAQFSSFAGQHTNDTWVGFDTSLFSLAPSAGSSGGNNAYCYRNFALSIANTNATWSDVAAAYFKGVRRVIGSPTITTQATVIIEPPTAGTTAQIGLLIRQQTAQATATTRSAIWVEAQNSGTNRFCFYGVSDTLYQGGKAEVIGTLGVTGAATFGNTISVAGTLKHSGTIVGIFGATPSTQYGTTGTEAGFTAGTSTAVTEDSTFTGNTGSLGYTIGDLVFAMKRLGALAY